MDFSDPRFSDAVYAHWPALAKVKVLRSARSFGAAYAPPPACTANADYRKIAWWEYDHTMPCELKTVEALHRAAPGCLKTLQHPFEGVTDLPGRSEKAKSDSACAAFERIRHELTLPVRGEGSYKFGSLTQMVQLEDLVAVHGHNPLTLRQVEVRVIGTSPGSAWKMDDVRLAAILACPSVQLVSLHHCDLGDHWLDRLIAGLGGTNRALHL